jgi:PAS domain S-box-containing protein
MKDEVKKVYDYVFESGEPSVYHTTGYGEYGGEAFLRVQAIPQMRDGAVNQITLIASDITETKRASDALRESQMRLNSIVDSALDAIITVDSSLKIVLFNKSAEKVFNCSSGDAIGTPVTRFISDMTKYVKDYRKNKVGKLPDISEFPGKGKNVQGLRTNGEIFPIEASVSKSIVENNVFYTIILRDISERIKSEDDLRDSFNKVRDLAAHLQSAREEERVNIAREIHDELGQELSALKMDISFLDRKIEKTKENPDWTAITDNLKSMKNITDQTIKTVRKISSQLRPDVLDKLGLNDAIEWLADDFTRRTGIQSKVDGAELPENIGKNIQTVLYRICQESLTNIMRYANASKALIKISLNENEISMEVIDDGKGITKEEIENGRSLGIVGMKERAYFVGGSFDICGEKGKGTITKVKIPMKKN